MNIMKPRMRVTALAAPEIIVRWLPSTVSVRPVARSRNRAGADVTNQCSSVSHSGM